MGGRAEENKSPLQELPPWFSCKRKRQVPVQEVESAPREARTPNLLFRRQTLCPIELWVPLQGVIIVYFRKQQTHLVSYVGYQVENPYLSAKVKILVFLRRQVMTGNVLRLVRLYP